MPGLDPGISLRGARLCLPYRDGRDKPGHDAEYGLTLYLSLVIARVCFTASHTL